MNLDELIAANIDDASHARGAAYWRNGNVRSAKWQKRGREAPVLIGRVSGSVGYYDQVIRVDAARGSIDGDCSCPVGHNCKHVVAALLAAGAAPGSDGVSITIIPPDSAGFALASESTGDVIARRPQLGEACRHGIDQRR